MSLSVRNLGDGILVCIYNKNTHIGAVAVGDYDYKERRVSVSVITRLGHKDDVIAQKAAYLITKRMKMPSCVVAGVHVDKVTEKEIEKLLENSEALVQEFLNGVKDIPRSRI